MQQYDFLIPVLVIIWIMLIGIRLGSYLDKKYGKYSLNSTIPEKVCPPHKWRWEEQPGLDNTWFMRCQRCMKTPREVGESP